MRLTPAQKNAIKSELVSCLGAEKEIRKIVIFGSFVHSADPHDMDIAIFQDSSEPYLPLAMKYRRMVRGVASKIAIDIIPLRSGQPGGYFMPEVEEGEIVYER